MAQRKKNGIEGAAAMCSKRRVAVLFRHLEGTTRRTDSFPERPGPRGHDGEQEIGPTPKVIQSVRFEQIAGHLSESITLIEVAEVAAGDQTHCRVVRWCSVAVAVLQPEIDSPADAEGAQIRVDVQGWYTQAGEQVDCCQSLRIPHQGQVNETSDRALSEPGPDALILATRFRLGGMG